MNVTLNKIAKENFLVFTIENQKSIIFILNEKGDKVEKIITDPQAIKVKLVGKKQEDYSLRSDIAVPIIMKIIKKTGNKYCKTKSGNLTFVVDTDFNVLKACTSFEYSAYKGKEELTEILLEEILFTEEQRFLYYKKKREIQELTIFENHSAEVTENAFADIKEKLKKNQSVSVGSLRIRSKKAA